MANVHFERRGTTAVLTLDNPPVNAMGVPLVRGIVEKLDAHLDDPGIKAFVITGAGKMFVAGTERTSSG